jgi:hypothetical protein
LKFLASKGGNLGDRNGNIAITWMGKEDANKTLDRTEPVSWALGDEIDGNTEVQ